MARPGNRNALKHGAYLNAAKDAARQVRDRFRQEAEQEARAILVAAGLDGDPLAALVARQIGRLEAKVARLQEYHERRGHFTRAGGLRPSVLTEGKFIGDLLGEARRLFDELRARSPAPSGERVYHAEFDDGSPALGDPATLPPLPHAGDDGPQAHAEGPLLDDRRSRVLPPAPTRRALPGPPVDPSSALVVARPQVTSEAPQEAETEDGPQPPRPPILRRSTIG